MGVEAYTNSVRARRVFELGTNVTKINLMEACFGDLTGDLEKTEVAQAAISATSLAEFLYLEELGLRPDAGIGHSLGEIPLLAMAGVISVEGMFKLIKARGEATARASALRPGMMAGLRHLDTKQVEEILGDLLSGGRLFLTNFNSRLQHVLSGDTDMIDIARERVKAAAQSAPELKNARLSRTRIPGAFHSPYHMQPATQRFRSTAKKIDYSEPNFTIMLNDGRYLGELGLSSLPNYLVGQLVGRVLFTEGIKRLIEDGITNFIQVGDRPVLSDLVMEDYSGTVNIVQLQKTAKEN